MTITNWDPIFVNVLFNDFSFAHLPRAVFIPSKEAGERDALTLIHKQQYFLRFAQRRFHPVKPKLVDF